MKNRNLVRRRKWLGHVVKARIKTARGALSSTLINKNGFSLRVDDLLQMHCWSKPKSVSSDRIKQISQEKMLATQYFSVSVRRIKIPTLFTTFQ